MTVVKSITYPLTKYDDGKYIKTRFALNSVTQLQMALVLNQYREFKKRCLMRHS